jgi:hypothetical protein
LFINESEFYYEEQQPFLTEEEQLFVTQEQLSVEEQFSS